MLLKLCPRSRWFADPSRPRRPASPSVLVEALHGADVEFAKRAADILPRIGKEALPALFEHAERTGRFPAPVALAIDVIAPTTEGLVPALVAAMRGPDAQVRILAAQALGRMGERVVPDLIAALEDADAETRHLCGATLGLMGTAARAAVPALIEPCEIQDRRPLVGRRASPDRSQSCRSRGHHRGELRIGRVYANVWEGLGTRWEYPREGEQDDRTR